MQEVIPLRFLCAPDELIFFFQVLDDPAQLAIFLLQTGHLLLYSRHHVLLLLARELRIALVVLCVLFFVFCEPSEGVKSLLGVKPTLGRLFLAERVDDNALSLWHLALAVKGHFLLRERVIDEWPHDVARLRDLEVLWVGVIEFVLLSAVPGVAVWRWRAELGLRPRYAR